MSGLESNILKGYSGYDGLVASNASIRLSNEALPTQSMAPVTESRPAREDMNVFFAIGITINIVMIIAFVIWARKELKKHGASKK